MMGNFDSIGRRMVRTVGMGLIISWHALSAAAEDDDGPAKITTLREIIGNPIDVFNGLDESTRTTVSWALGLILLILAVCVVVGISKNTAKTAIGSSTQNAKMSTSGIQDNILLGATILVGVIILGIAFGLIMGI